VKVLLLIGCSLCFATSLFAQSGIRGLPAGAVIVETRSLPRRNRALILWMLSPKRNPNQYAPDDVYSCPDYSRGSYYSGPARVSVINSATNNIINTITVKEDDGDSLDLPYAIRRGYYYRVASSTRTGVEAKPTIMWLKDYNGDGKALEFALLDAQACMGLNTTLIGYSEKQDRVIQYPVELEVIEGSKHSHIVTMWADYLFNKKPQRPGHWKYEIDYRGRAGTLDKWEVQYNPAQERFEGKLTALPGN